MRRFLLTLITLFPAAAMATGMTPLKDMAAGEYKLDMAHSSLHFKVSHLGLSDYTARFTDFSAALTLNPEAPEKSVVKATINPASIETDYPNPEEKDFDKKLATGEEWFNAGAFPSITFDSGTITRTGDTTATMNGMLTMLGVTKPLKLDVTFNGAYENKPFANVPALGVSAVGTMVRSDWGFDAYVPGIGDEVEIILELEFHKVAEEKAE